MIILSKTVLNPIKNSNMKRVVKISILTAAMMFAAAGFHACKKDKTIHVEGVTLSQNSLTLTVGQSQPLLASVVPTDAANKNITWTTSAASIATVNNGTVTAVAAGQATITATSADGGKTATCTVTVNVAFVAVTGIAGVPTTAIVNVDLTLGGTVQPGNATNQTISWSIANAGTTGATITSGKFKATAVGTAQVTATIVNGATATTDYTNTFPITVTAAPLPFVAVTGIDGLPTTAFVNVELTLGGTVQPGNATNQTISWSVTNAGTTGAAITGGNKFKATATGAAQVTATIVNGASATSNYVQPFTINVSEPPGIPDKRWYTSNPSASSFNINAPEQLAGLAQLVNDGTSDFSGKTINLTANIDLSSYYGYGVASWNGGQGWVPIGVVGNFFKGTFNGGKKKISGLYINNAALDNASLFGVINGGTVRDLDVVIDSHGITANLNVGGITGQIDGNLIERCSVTGGGIAGYRGSGGIAGFVRNATVTDSYTTVNVTGGYDYVGGIAGQITGGAGKAIRCYSSGAISGTEDVGGIAGLLFYGGTGTTIRYCVALNPSITRSSGANTRLSRVTNAGGGGPDLTSNYALSTMTVLGSTVSGGTATNNNGANVTDATAKTQAFYTGTVGGSWDFTNVWQISAGSNYPTLRR